MDERERVHLIDGSGYIFRAYYAIRPLSAHDGTPTNAVIGFARMLGKLLRDEKPSKVAIAFDGPTKTFRHALYAEYKANRQAAPEDLIPQFALIRELVNVMRIQVLDAPGYEADDVLATLTLRAIAAGHHVVVVSADKDLMQLVGPDVELFDPMKDRHYDARGVQERLGVPPAHVVDLLALCGDSSDNIPGVPKVGPKSATQLINAHGGVEAIIAALGTTDKPKAYERSVLEHVDSARLSLKLAQLDTNAPVTNTIEALTYEGPDRDALAAFLRRMDAFALVRELGLSEAPQPAPAAAVPLTRGAAGIDRSRYKTVLAPQELAVVLSAADRARCLSVDLETTSLDSHHADIVGIALAVPEQLPVYIPLAHRYLGAPKQLERQAVLARLQPMLEAADFPKVGQGLKYDTSVLARAGITLRGVRDDSLLAAYVLDPSRSSFSLDSLAAEFLGHETIRYKDVVGSDKDGRGFEAVEIAAATAYAAEDADVALRLCERFAADVREQHLEPVYRDVEMPLMPILARMEQAGVRVDTPHLRALGSEFEERLGAVQQKAQTLAGTAVNLASPKQLAALLFDKLQLPVVKKTKTGPSTDQEVLEQLAAHHPLPGVILEYRLLAKLKSTYIDALLALADPKTQRVHTTFNQTGAATGRLSSTDPNLQNIPIRTPDGRRIRQAFVAADGHTLIAADYSQIELRIMAHLSGDERFIAAFRQGEDIHRRTAMEVLTDGREPDSEARRQAKAINFGLLYGLSEFGLSRQLGIPRTVAGDYIHRYFARYPKLRLYLDATIERARESGYVATITGRRRFLPDLRSKNHTLRMAAERIAMNTPIQGSAADIIKLAMIRIAKRLAQERSGARLLLQVHDELVLEAPHGDAVGAVALVEEEMSHVMELLVPLDVAVGVGGHWGEAHAA